MQVQAPAPTDLQNMAKIKQLLVGPRIGSTGEREDGTGTDQPDTWQNGTKYSSLCRVQDAIDHWLVLNYYGYLYEAKAGLFGE